MANKGRQNNRKSFKETIKYLKKEQWTTYESSLITTETNGMRVGEFTKLKVQDLDFEERFIRIPEEVRNSG